MSKQLLASILTEVVFGWCIRGKGLVAKRERDDRWWWRVKTEQKQAQWFIMDPHCKKSE